MDFSQLVQTLANAATIAAIGGLIIGLAMIKPNKAKSKAETDKIITDAMERVSTSAVSLLDPYEEQLEYLKKHLIESNSQSEELNNKLREANRRASTLQDELDSATRKIAYFEKRVSELQEDLSAAYREIERSKG